MHQGLIRVLKPDKRGTPRWKWVRPDGKKPPSQANSHRRNYVLELRKKCVQLLGGKCVECGYEKNIQALQIDHVNSDGSIDRNTENPTKTGGSYYHNILKYIDSGRYQILCANCNMIKRSEKKECPRKEEP